MSRKWYSRSPGYFNKSVTILLALALVLSLCIVVVPVTTTVQAGILPTVVWVDDDWTGPGDCGGHIWYYNAFNSTQDGVNGVANGGMVYAEGEYTGFCIIERSGISVVGTEGVIVNNPSTYQEEFLPCLTYIFSSTDITIEGIEFQCPLYEPTSPGNFGDFPQPFLFPVVAGIGCFNSTGTISSVTVKDMLSPLFEEWLAAGIYVVGGLIDETMTISDSTTVNCTVGIMVLADHVILDNCSISGVAIEGYGSWGIFAMLSIVDMLNCNITGCRGGWEELWSVQEGFGQPDGLFGSSGIITIFAGLRMNGCTISNNDVGMFILPPEAFEPWQPDSFSNYATDRLQVNHGSFENGEPPFLSFLTTTANLNNIAGNTYFGILHGIDEIAMDATNNWWGSVNGPELFDPVFNCTGYATMAGFEGNPDTGDAVAGNMTYIPWLGAPLSLPAVHQQSLAAGDEQVVNASEEAGTTITITTTGATNITIASYESQPFPDKEFPDVPLGKYIDIYVSNPEVVNWPIHVELSYTQAELVAAGVEESSLGLYYYAPDESLRRCSNTGVNTVYNYIWANLTETEAGSLAGSPFGSGGEPYTIGGEAYPVNKVNLLIPLIAIGIAAVAGVSIIWKRRRSVD